MDKKRFEKVDNHIWKAIGKNVYYVEMYLGRDKNNKQVRVSKKCASLRDAQKQRALLEAQRAEGGERTLQIQNIPTIDELMDIFRKLYIEVNTEETTSFGYKTIENHIKDFFDISKHNRRVDKITASVIDEYYVYLLNKKSRRAPNGMSVSSIRKHKDYLNLLFGYAVKHRDLYGIKENPVIYATLPRGKKSEGSKTPDISWYNVDNIEKFNEKLMETKDYPLICAVHLALFGGMRRGEMEYLKWDDVDLETGMVDIRGSRTMTDKVIEKDTPKSGYMRTTSLCALAVESLRVYKEQQEYHKKIQGKSYKNEEGYVLVKPDGEPYSVKWINKKFSEFLDKNGFPHIRYHDLRHINASILLQIIPLADVSKHLGHTTVNTTTRIYAHSIMRDKNTIGNSLDKVFG